MRAILAKKSLLAVYQSLFYHFGTLFALRIHISALVICRDNDSPRIVFDVL